MINCIKLLNQRLFQISELKKFSKHLSTKNIIKCNFISLNNFPWTTYWRQNEAVRLLTVIRIIFWLYSTFQIKIGCTSQDTRFYLSKPQYLVKNKIGGSISTKIFKDKIKLVFICLNCTYNPLRNDIFPFYLYYIGLLVSVKRWEY